MPAAGVSLQNISRLAFRDAGQGVLQPKLMNPHQEMNPRINENDTKLVNKGKKKRREGKKQIQLPAGQFLSNYRC